MCLGGNTLEFRRATCLLRSIPRTMRLGALDDGGSCGRAQARERRLESCGAGLKTAVIGECMGETAAQGCSRRSDETPAAFSFHGEEDREQKRGLKRAWDGARAPHEGGLLVGTGRPRRRWTASCDRSATSSPPTPPISGHVRF